MFIIATHIPHKIQRDKILDTIRINGEPSKPWGTPIFKME
jgi:hypothetical protein